MSGDKEEKVASGTKATDADHSVAAERAAAERRVTAALRQVVGTLPPDRLQRALGAILSATEVDAPASGMPGGAFDPARDGGRWLHLRVDGPDHTHLNHQALRDHARAVAADHQALRDHAARAQAAEAPQEERRFALLEVNDSDADK